MEINLEAILWYLFLLDSIGANLMAWFFRNWYENKWKRIPRHFPATKSWCLAYLCLLLWLGFALQRNGILPW
jgi:hypothetical protein